MPDTRFKRKNPDLLAEPRDAPRPTYWPFFLAFGVTLMFWGILANWVFSALGAIVFAVAIAGWLSDLNQAYKIEDDERQP